MPEGAVILDSAIPQKAMGLAIEQQERLRKEAMARKAAEDKAKADAADDFAKAKAQALKPLENPNEAYLYAANKALENDINAVTLDPTLKTQAEKEKRMAEIATRRHILNEGLKARIASNKELMAKSLLADPNLDMTKLEKDYNASLGKSYIAGLNAPDGMPVGDVDFNTFLENNYTKYLLGTTPVKNAVEKMKREAKTEKYINRLGGSNDWTVQLSDLAKVNFDENKDPIIKYPFEEVPLSSGVKVKTFPKTIEDAFISNQGKSFLKAKESQVEKAIDDNKSLLYTNLDSPLRGKTKKEYDALSKEDKDIVNRYLDYYIIKGYDNSYVRKVEKKDIPANKITVNVNNGRGGGLGGGGGQNAIPDFDQLLEHKFSENGAKITQEIDPKTNKPTGKSIILNADGTPKNGLISIPKRVIPQDIISYVQGYGKGDRDIDFTTASDDKGNQFVTAYVEDGKIQRFATKEVKKTSVLLDPEMPALGKKEVITESPAGYISRDGYFIKEQQKKEGVPAKSRDRSRSMSLLQRGVNAVKERFAPKENKVQKKETPKERAIRIANGG